MDVIFFDEIRHILKVYIDDVILKTLEEENHCGDVENILSRSDDITCI